MGNGGPNPGDVFDVRKVRRFVELMKEHELAEIDLRDGERRIRLRTDRDLPQTFTAVPAAPSAPAAASSSLAAASETAASPAPAEGSEAAFIASPMVGTFYAAPNPDSAPFVKVGDQVGVDTVVCIVEAMKVFNEIPAEMSGKIAAVLVENGESVEYGQKLFRVE